MLFTGKTAGKCCYCNFYLLCKCTTFSYCHFLISHGGETVSLCYQKQWQTVRWQLGAPWKCYPSTLEVIYLVVSWGQLTLGKFALLVKKLWLVQKPECGLKACNQGKHDLHTASYVKLKFITNTWKSRLKYLLIFCLAIPAVVCAS